MVRKRVLLGASYSVIEPLGLLHLGGLARDLDWDRKFHLVKDHDFEPFFETVKDYKPDLVGFNVYTGNHLQLHEAFKRLKKDHPGIATVVGGPHPTYFPSESAEHADYVVMSEGFGALRKILTGEAKPGILPMTLSEPFPHPDRKTFYENYPEHGRSRIKSVITMTGCPYACTYCYNSSTPDDIKDNMPPEVADALAESMGMGGRLFPHNVRTVEAVVNEGIEIAESWPTDVIYSQDDVHGFDIRNWMPQFAQQWPGAVGIPYHAQMRWEMTKGSEGKRRLDVLRDAGCFGLTLAIEAADPHIRKEVLDRGMPAELMYDGMKEVIDRGFKVRTEQITALPYGATSEETKMNLEADLELVELNVDLRKKTGGPTMAWGSTLAPYRGTKLGAYCEKNGHYRGDNSDVPDTFFERSVLRFPKEWVGLDLENRKDDPGIWLGEEELDRYRNQNAELRRHFNLFSLIPEGHRLAKSYLESSEEFSYERLGEETEDHLRSLYEDENAVRIIENIDSIRESAENLDVNGHANLKEDLSKLAPYLACLPKAELSVDRAVRYASERGNGRLTPNILSTVVRHHLYDEVLYSTEGLTASNRTDLNDLGERYPSKV